MEKTKFIWKNGKMIEWDNATTHVLTHGLHYGSGVFEGIRFYQTKTGPAIFRLKEHVKRFFYSARALEMKINFSEEQICKAIIKTVKDNKISSGYIRPLAYYGYGSMKVVPTADLPVDVIISCWSWGNYLQVKAVDIAISPYIRIHPKSTVADAKISGHYVNSILSGLSIRNTKYHEALLLDSEGFVAEGSAENIFIIKNKELITTPAGTILIGITRDTVMQIAKELNLNITERKFKPQEVIDADEAFFCGTAVEITPIRSLDDKIISDGNIGPITKQIQSKYNQIIRAEDANYINYLSFINK